MEILFENTYTRNKALAKEIYRYFYFQRKILIVLYVLLGLSFLANIAQLIFSDTYNLGVLVCVPFFFCFQAVSYFRQVATLVKRDIEVHGKEITVDTVVTDTYIQNNASTGSVNKVEYHNIRYAVQTKNCILLQSKANQIYIFHKDTFTVGSKEAFLQFLRSKNIKIK